MPGKRPVRRSVHVGFRLTKAEQKLVKQCRQGDEVFSETARRLLHYGCAQYESVQSAAQQSPAQQFGAFGLSPDPE